MLSTGQLLGEGADLRDSWMLVVGGWELRIDSPQKPCSPVMRTDTSADMPEAPAPDIIRPKTTCDMVWPKPTMTQPTMNMVYAPITILLRP